jgi:hypothetical protein
MANNVQLSDEANTVLDEYMLEADKVKQKGKIASDAVVSALLPELSDLRQRLILSKYPDLASILSRKKRK